MPAKSRAQQRLMQAAEHGATFPLAVKVRQSMTHDQMHDFAVGSESGKPEHVTAPTSGRRSPAQIEAGLRKAHGAHPNASRLGKFLHPKGGY